MIENDETSTAAVTDVQLVAVEIKTDYRRQAAVCGLDAILETVNPTARRGCGDRRRRCCCS